MSEIEPGIYTVVYPDGTRVVSAAILGPTHRVVLVQVDPPTVHTAFVEDNWRGMSIRLIPLVRQGGLSGALYWDDDGAITIEEQEHDE